uniref:Fzo/mitofusin HR2 domain-containing protein n=1 Tax=Glossina pallidipes TaxID=7398 RepID=A0A1A9ZWT0_GLOPL
MPAREVLQGRVEAAKGNSPSLGAIAEGFQLRYFEFQDFERAFEECISKSAVQTKFEKHSSRGKVLASEMCEMLEEMLKRVSAFLNEKLDQKTILIERIRGTEIEMINATRETELQIHDMIEEVEQKVSKTLNEEIRCLSVLIDKFNMPFHPGPLMLNFYKKELNSYVEKGLDSNLRARMSMALTVNIDAAQREMTERMHALVPNEKFNEQAKQILARTQPFQMLYSLNCQNLCADFQEALEFKFSWGISAMLQRFTGKIKKKMRKNRASIKGSSSAQLASLTTPTGIKEQMSIVSRLALASTGFKGTVGGLAVSGIMLKMIGWRLLAGFGALYGCLYMYERLSWTRSAKKRAFKSQYIHHATKKLKMIVDLTSANCSHQVQQELGSTFTRLCRTVTNAIIDMNDELKTLEAQITILENTQKQVKLLRNKANYIQNELKIFENIYIKSN